MPAEKRSVPLTHGCGLVFLQKLLLAYKAKQEGRPGRTVNKKNERQRNSRQNKTDKAEPEKYGRQKNGIFPMKKDTPGRVSFCRPHGVGEKPVQRSGLPGKKPVLCCGLFK